MQLRSGQEFRQFARHLGSYIGSSGALLASSVALLLTFGLLARHLGHEQFALNATITALTNIGIQICGLGSQESLVRRVAQEPGFYPDMLGHVHILNLVSGAVLVVVGMIAIPVLYPVSEQLFTTLFATALILITNIVLLKIIWLATNSYIAHSRFSVANRIEFLFAILRMAAAVVSCLVFNITTVAEWAVWNFAAHAIVAAVALVAIRRLGRPKFRIVREEVPIGIMFASQFFFKAGRSNADILVLSAVAGSEIVGSYSIARRLTEASYMAVEALNRIVYPSYAAAALNGIAAVLGRAKQMLLLTTVIGIASGLFVWIVTPWLPMLFGHEYVSLSWITRSLCWAVIPIAVSATAFEALGASSLQSIRARILNLSNIVGAVLVAAAAYYASVTGVVVATYGIEILIAVLGWQALFAAQKAVMAETPPTDVDDRAEPSDPRAA
ncbi:lipopolysaccharide biosynthesis protein [Neorhizobium sp. NCHU2750]|uniref:lipopolysaccharide biosynthesis protein n=1 Tax=Neorhizobium sp. NCHU2750 TaxID=1825976 RepID=UPI000EB72472|nr:sugar transporter [Neorhizobium sp. NCHU2750]